MTIEQISANLRAKWWLRWRLRASLWDLDEYFPMSPEFRNYRKELRDKIRVYDTRKEGK